MCVCYGSLKRAAALAWIHVYRLIIGKLRDNEKIDLIDKEDTRVSDPNWVIGKFTGESHTL